MGVQYIDETQVVISLPRLQTYSNRFSIMSSKVMLRKMDTGESVVKNKGIPFTIDFRSVEGATLRPISDIVGIIALLSRGRLGGTLISRDEVHLHINKVCRCKS